MALRSKRSTAAAVCLLVPCRSTARCKSVHVYSVCTQSTHVYVGGMYTVSACARGSPSVTWRKREAEGPGQSRWPAVFLL
eukprot:639620-Pelagomonas_calceolata.AAC.1